VDTALVKHAPPLPFRLPDGTIIHLAPLPRRRLELLALHADLELRAWGGQLLLRRVLPGRILAAASGCELDLYQAELDAMLGVWSWWQRRCNDTRGLADWLRRRAYDDPATIQDGAAAHRAGSPGAYYGRPEVDLTDGQVAYWQLLAGAFVEWHGPGPRKVPTRQWLQGDPNE
jgi:hypothetical protein